MEELNVGSGKKCSSCGGTVAAGRKTCQNCGHSFTTASEEFGDVEGHAFHGNQYSQAMIDAMPTKTIRQLQKGDRFGMVMDDGKFEEIGTVHSKGNSVFEPGKPVVYTQRDVDAAKGTPSGAPLGNRFESHGTEVKIISGPGTTGDSKLDADLDRIFKRDALAARVDAIEDAVLALAAQEFGDSEGHPFHGNQWREVDGIDVKNEKNATGAPLPPEMQRHGRDTPDFTHAVSGVDSNFTSWDDETTQRVIDNAVGIAKEHYGASSPEADSIAIAGQDIMDGMDPLEILDEAQKSTGESASSGRAVAAFIEDAIGAS